MENQGPLILDISSDEEAGFADVKKGGAGEFGDREDVDWLSKLLVEVGQNKHSDSDDVIIVSEVFAKPPKKSRSESMKPLIKVVDGDDDDCVVLDSDPGKAILVVSNKVDDGDDLEIIGEKGEVACRDFPHPRHHCAKYPFTSTPHESHCDQCHCYVCDSVAPCSHWGTGISSIDHCHASDKEEYWKSERKQVRKSYNKPVSDIRSRSNSGTRLESYFQPVQVPRCGPVLPNALPQNQGFNPVTFRPCALSSNAIPPNAVRSQPSVYVAPRYNPQSHHRSANIIAPKVASRNKSYPLGIQNTQSFPPCSVFKRSGLIGSSRHHSHANRSQLPINKRPSFHTHVRNRQIVGSQPELSSPLNMEQHSPSEPPQINCSPYSSYQYQDSSSQPFVSGNSMSPPPLQSFRCSQPTANINTPAAPEPYTAFIPVNPVKSQNVASCQLVAGNAFSYESHSRTTNSSLDFDRDSSSQLQDPQSGLDDFSLLCNSSISHGDIQIHAEQSQYPPAEIAQIQDSGVEVAAASFDFESIDSSWGFENESFSGPVEASASLNWNVYSPEPAFPDTGSLFRF